MKKLNLINFWQRLRMFVADVNVNTSEDKDFNDLTQQEANLQTQLNNPDLSK
jgi:hypothetical protein